MNELLILYISRRLLFHQRKKKELSETNVIRGDKFLLINLEEKRRGTTGSESRVIFEMQMGLLSRRQINPSKINFGPSKIRKGDVQKHTCICIYMYMYIYTHDSPEMQRITCLNKRKPEFPWRGKFNCRF